jgi:hypothetical protein
MTFLAGTVSLFSNFQKPLQDSEGRQGQDLPRLLCQRRTFLGQSAARHATLTQRGFGGTSLAPIRFM